MLSDLVQENLEIIIGNEDEKVVCLKTYQPVKIASKVCDSKKFALEKAGKHKGSFVLE